MIKYQLRAYYPNFYFIRRVLSDPYALAGKNAPGELVPELEYEKDGVISRIHPDNIGLYILLQDDKKEAERYIRLLIDSAVHPDAGIRLKRITGKWLKILETNFRGCSFIENNHTIPSVTTREYDELLLSQKGKVLLGLYQQGYPVPDFCVLTSQSFQLDTRARESCISDAVQNLENMTGQKLGDPDNALVFAMRSATPYYIPGLMPTYLNVGVTRMSYRSLDMKYGQKTANKIYLNNLESVLKILCAGTDFSAVTDADDANLGTEEKIDKLFRRIERIDERMLYDAMYQTRRFMRVSHDFFKRNQDLIYTFQHGNVTYPSLILQKMVWTVRNQESYPGVLYSRHPRTGLGMQIESVREIFGEDIMTGMVHADQREYFERGEVLEEFPAIYHFTPMLPKLEENLKSPATIEFAAESHKNTSLFAILQLNMSELTGRATLLSAIDMYSKGVIPGKRVIQLIRPYHLRQIFSERIDDASLMTLKFFGKGLSVLPRSAVSVRVFFTMAKALEAKKKGEKVCLCKENFIPSETIFMGELDAVMSMNPLAIHVVTACLGYGIPAFINLRNFNMELKDEALFNSQGLRLCEGDWITLSSKLHSIFCGKAVYRPARFQKYLEGKTFEMEPKEEKVFINMKKAYEAYQSILNTIKTDEAVSLPDLVKLIRNDYDRQPQKALQFVNGWFDNHHEYYFSEILKSGLGSHLDQHKIYNLLTTERRIYFFRNIYQICTKSGQNGFSAGAFMLGRFLCNPHPVVFWNSFTPQEIVFLLNEHILFEKYLQVLTELGERHLNRTRNRILTHDLKGIPMPVIDLDLFLPLKLSRPDWDAVEDAIGSDHDKGIFFLTSLFRKPYGVLYEYDKPWSFAKLKKICETEQISIPDRRET
ncbi:MAG: hypothetical protein ACM3N9_02570 [Syntrophothermus sp.]